MRQYRIFYRRFGSKDYSILQPHTQANLYDKPDVNAAIEHMRANPVVEGMALRLSNEQFNIVSFDQPAEAPQAFTFHPHPAVAATESSRFQCDKPNRSVSEGETVPKTNA